jgi:hypothetical protein
LLTPFSSPQDPPFPPVLFSLSPFSLYERSKEKEKEEGKVSFFPYKGKRKRGDWVLLFFFLIERSRKKGRAAFFHLFSSPYSLP